MNKDVFRLLDERHRIVIRSVFAAFDQLRQPRGEIVHNDHLHAHLLRAFERGNDMLVLDIVNGHCIIETAICDDPPIFRRVLIGMRPVRRFADILVKRRTVTDKLKLFVAAPDRQRVAALRIRARAERKNAKKRRQQSCRDFNFFHIFPLILLIRPKRYFL
ncbi:MAG: hypothetical protein HFE26_02365 [Clostridia bacterium]|nr:hypothetical protein [Clostridia bacterium]